MKGIIICNEYQGRDAIVFVFFFPLIGVAHYARITEPNVFLAQHTCFKFFLAAGRVVAAFISSCYLLPDKVRLSSLRFLECHKNTLISA